MVKNAKRPVQVAAMHGWAGDSRCWQHWIEETAHLGWQWHCGERGYGKMVPRATAWPENAPPGALRVVVGHSLGPHLVQPEILQSADAVVMLASFASFVPPDRAGRRVRTALDGMAAKLGSEIEAKDMLEKFFINVAHPEPPELLPQGPAEGPLNLDRLRADLDVLRDCRGLPAGFPPDARVLIVEAGQDRIVDPEARAILREALPAATVILLPNAGHGLLGTDVVGRVRDWADSLP